MGNLGSVPWGVGEGVRGCSNRDKYVEEPRRFPMLAAGISWLNIGREINKSNMGQFDKGPKGYNDPGESELKRMLNLASSAGCGRACKKRGRRKAHPKPSMHIRSIAFPRLLPLLSQPPTVLEESHTKSAV